MRNITRKILGIPKWEQRLRDNDPTLTTLELKWKSLGNADVHDIIQALKDNTFLTKLDLEGNNIGELGAQMLGTFLKVNSSLTHLNLRNNPIGVKGMQALAEGLNVNNTLIYLNLCGTLTSNFDVLTLDGTLLSATNSQTLTGVKALSQMLQKNKSLTHLDLGENLIDDLGAQVLASALKTNSSLVTLELFDNKIGDKGIRAFARLLQDTHALRALNLGENEIDIGGIKDLTIALEDNYTLTNLILNNTIKASQPTLWPWNNNQINNENLLSEIKKFIQRNQSLEKDSQAQYQHALSRYNQGLEEIQQATMWYLKAINQTNTPVQTQAALQGLAQLSKHSMSTYFKTSKTEKEESALASPNSAKAERKEPLAILEISFHIAADSLRLEKEIGKDNFGIVYQGKWNGTDVNIKKLNAEFEKSGEFQNKLKTIMRLQHPNIVRLYGITSVSPYCMVMEYCPQGNLSQFLPNLEKLSWEQLAQIALDIALGLAYLHKQNILHGELMSNNVLLDQSLTAKLANVGLSNIKIGESVPSTTAVINSLKWLAPEVSKGGKFTLQAEVYSYGVIIWELSVCKNPGENSRNNLSIGKWMSGKGEHKEIPAEMPQKLASIMQQCWENQIENRPTSEVIIEELEELKEELRSTQMAELLNHTDQEEPLLVSEFNLAPNSLVHSRGY